MSEIVYCDDEVHHAMLLKLSMAPLPKADLHVAYKLSWPSAQLENAVESETHTRRLCPQCWERIEADLNAIVRGLGKKVKLVVEASTI